MEGLACESAREFVAIAMLMRYSYSRALVFFCLAVAVDAVDDTINKFVIDAIGKNGIGPISTRVIAFLCLEKGAIQSLMKLASKNQVAMLVLNASQTLDGDIFFNKNVNRHLDYYIYNLKCPGAATILQKVSLAGLFGAPSKWLLLQDSRDRYNSSAAEEPVEMSREIWEYEIFENLTIFPDSDVVIGQRIGRDYVKLVSVYRPSPVRGMVIEDRGYWDDRFGIHLNNVSVSSRRRRNLQKTPLRSCLAFSNPDTINHLTDFSDKHIDPLAKVNYPWAQFLVEMMNATVSFTPTDSWGYPTKNGTWNGMVGMLDRGEIDFGGTALFLDKQRLDVIAYISLSTATRVKFVFRNPPLSYVSNVFTLTFRPSVWIASGIILTLVAVFLYAAVTWEWNSTTAEERAKPHWAGTMIRVTWSENLLIIIGAVSQQGSMYEPRGSSSRIIILMLFVAVLSLYTSYTANIVVLFQSSSSSINSLETLLHSSLSFGIHDTFYNRHFFSTAKDPVRKSIYEQKVVPKGQKSAWMSADEGVRLLRQGLSVFHGEVGPIYDTVQRTFREDEKCGFQEIDYLGFNDPMIPIAKQSPYMELFRVGAIKIHECGLQIRHLARIYTKRPVCHEKTSFVNLGLIDCYAAFAVLVYGSIMSIILLFVEIFWNGRKDTSTNSMTNQTHSTLANINKTRVEDII